MKVSVSYLLPYTICATVENLLGYLLLQLPADPRISGFPSDHDLLLLPRVKREYRMKGYTGSVIESMTPGHYTLVQYSVDSFGSEFFDVYMLIHCNLIYGAPATSISPLKKYTFLDPIVKTRSVTRNSSAGSGKLTVSVLYSLYSILRSNSINSPHAYHLLLSMSGSEMDDAAYQERVPP